MTQDTEVEVAHVNRGMSLRYSKKKSNLLNDARIKACISRYDNSTYTHIQFLRVVGHCVGSHALCPEDGSAESDVDDDDNQEEVSVDSGDDQPSADVGSQDLCEVCMIAQRDTPQALVPCGHQRFFKFCGSCITKIEKEGRGCPMCRAPITMILRLFYSFLLVN